MNSETSKQETDLENVRITGHLHNAKIPQLNINQINQLVSGAVADKELFDCITTEKVEQFSKAHNDLGFTIDRLKKIHEQGRCIEFTSEMIPAIDKEKYGDVFEYNIRLSVKHAQV
ncbi:MULTISPECIES: hypothetical protein [Bacillus]|uniref:hypothetical protein n=1 Tax=Bacillus TaxID=1386 RepID=UPI0006AF6369|nr:MULTISPECIES: hypothetical protein [Bacillus]AWD86561.1 hypothetical protein BVQ_03380 [Bacillus velezensis]KAF6688551.1 hypothetical protein G9362_20355 [Bacillus sp. EKM601B]KOS49338.1 hypothetical protein AN272_19115 [Bacillus amyloliquefaciens]MBA9150645.1 hypothetical protein [Bacillus sp. EKM213B]MDZ7430906.1 hypothetical protein [Bacillus amyloliquefaciens]